jgi:uroporphyrinogen decarboxylase
MTPRERGIAALECRQPDDIVPTFELVYFLGPEKFGLDWTDGINEMTGAERDRALHEHAELHVKIAEEYDYSIIRSDYLEAMEILKGWGCDRDYLLFGEADGTMSIPNGSNMVDLSIEMRERPEDVHARMRSGVEGAIESGKKNVEAGADGVTMCADYCFNVGPFLSPDMFREFVTPYLTEIIAAHRENGLYTIKHTDGNIMPILDQLAEANPHALHSIDPQAGVDLAEVKRIIGDHICLCGNVNCGLLQTGTDEEVREDIARSLRDGMPGGGFIFATSNCAFRGLPLERYEMMMEMRKELGRYDTASA